MDEIICCECKKKFNCNMTSCPNCGCPTSYSIDNKNEILIKDNNKLLIAEDIYIEAEGNRMKAIKLLKEKLEITNDEALNLINIVCDKYEKKNKDNSVVPENKYNIFNSLKNIETEPIAKKNNDVIKVKPPKVQVVSTNSRKSLLSTGVRGLIGGALLGQFGLVVGAVSGKNKTKTTFVKRGLFGHKKIVTAKNNSRKFKKLAKKM